MSVSKYCTVLPALGILFIQSVWLHLLLATQGRSYQLLAREPPEGAAKWGEFTEGEGSEQGVLRAQYFFREL